MSSVLPSRYLWSLLVALAVAWTSSAIAQETAALPSETALDRYVQQEDATYEWKLLKTIESRQYTGYVVEMKSQTWRTPEEVNRTVWEHHLTVVRPKELKTNKAFLFISGGSNNNAPPEGISPLVLPIVSGTGAVVAELKQIPNQPLEFHGDGQMRNEDDLIAYTWKKFIETGDESWPARLPMVKASVRAMDTITALLASEEGGQATVDEFVVAGGSKRGWTTWLTGAADPRVVAIAPVVIDILNVRESMNHHFAAYGFWAPAVGDYVHHGITELTNHPRHQDLMDLVDPYSYRHRLTMPKYLVNASGDEFFLPDSSQFYWDELQGEKLLRYVPNASHSLAGSDAPQSIMAWFHAVINDRARPQYSWTFEDDGAIRVESADRPQKVVLWHATNPEARDFRLEKIGRAYKGEELSETESGVWVGRVPQPEQGFTAYFIELAFDCGLPQYPLKVSTAVRVVPDVLPFADQAPNARATAAAAGN